MEEKRYKEQGRIFESVKIPQTYFKNGPLGIYPQEEGDNSEGSKGIIYNNDEITQVVPFINAVDIDWNKANVGENGQIKTTADLLNWIENDALDLRSVMFKLAKSGSIILCDEAYIKNLWSKNINTDYLTVNKAAHFFELIVDQMRSVQGTQINTAANCVADFVEPYNNEGVSTNNEIVSYYRIYWRNSNSDGKSIDNNWKVNDQAYCQTFNISPGTTNNVGNTYYWRLVTATSNDEGKSPVFINFDKKEIVDTPPETYIIEFSDFSTNNFTCNQNEWDNGTLIWTPSDISSKLEIYPNEEEIFENNLFTFETDITTKLNVLIYYKDGTQEYIPATTYLKEYRISFSENKKAERIIITTAVIDKWEQCNWIDLSNEIKDNGSVPPAVGDNIAQLGYRYGSSTDPDEISRASAIIIAAYATPDSGITPPSYAQYQNITTFELNKYRKTYFDANKAKFVGEFQVDAGGQTSSLSDYIKANNPNNPLSIQVNLNNSTSILNSIFIQANESGIITELGSFPSSLSVGLNYNDQPVQPTILTLTFNGVNYNLLEENQEFQPANSGIYIQSISNSTVTFAFSGESQEVRNDTIEILGQYEQDEETYQARYTIPITVIKSTRGTDGEIYKLYKVNEYAVVENVIKNEHTGEKDQRLRVYLKYAIQHVIGNTSEIIDNNNYEIRITQYNLNGESMGNVSGYTLQKNENNYWIYSGTTQEWYQEDNNAKCVQLETKLIRKNPEEVLDTSIINVITEPVSLFSVTNGLTSSVQALENSYTSVTQATDRINSAVVQHSEDLNSLKNYASEIAQMANSISMSTSNIVKFQNGEFPISTDYEEYVYLINNGNTPATPSGKITYNEIVPENWTITQINPTENNTYLWFSKRTFPQELDILNDSDDSLEPEWSEWSTPKILQIFGQSKGYVNKADLVITSDAIRSEVSSNYIARNGFENEVKSIINQEAGSITTQVTNSLENRFSNIEQTAESISSRVTWQGGLISNVDQKADSINMNIINGLLRVGIDINGENSKIKLEANSTDFYTPTGQKMISVEMCTEEGEIDHENGTIPSIIFYNQYNKPQWILNYLVGMQKVFVSEVQSWYDYALIKFGTTVSTTGMSGTQKLYPEAFFPSNSQFDPNTEQPITENNEMMQQKVYKFNAAYGKDTNNNITYIPTNAESIDGSFWINTSVKEEDGGYIPNNTNNLLNGYYIINQEDDNDSFKIHSQSNSEAPSINFLDNDVEVTMQDKLNILIGNQQISQNSEILDNISTNYQSGITSFSTTNYEVGIQPINTDIWAIHEHYDKYILLEFEDGWVINRINFIIYYKTLVNQNGTKIKYVLKELENGEYIRPSKIIIPKGESQTETDWITINGLISN